MSVAASARPLLMGHRGCRVARLHENSLEAFACALDSGCDGFEFDVRQTADRKTICVHDAAIGKLQVSESTYDELLNEYFKKKSEPPPEPIPLLDDVLQAFANTAFLDIELKVPRLEQHVLELLRRFPPQRGYLVSSFQPEIICHLAELDPELQLGFIFDGVAGLRAWLDLPGPYVIPRHDLVSRELVDTVHDADRKILAWTVNHPHEMSRLAGWGIDGLISDDPALLYQSIHGQ